MSAFDDLLWSHLVGEHGHLLADAPLAVPEARSPRRRRRSRRLLVALTGVVAIAAGIVLSLGPATGSTPEAFAVVSHSDGTVTITIKEISGIDGLNRRLAELGVKAKAYMADPSCMASAEESPGWDALYPKIVVQNGPAPEVTIRPDAIPTDATLLIEGQYVVPGRLDVMVTLVRSPAPSCMHNVLRLAPPPPPGIGVPPRQPVRGGSTGA